jgi:hypothetical protein
MNLDTMRPNFPAVSLVGKHVRFRYLPKDSKSQAIARELAGIPEAGPILVSGARKNMISLTGWVGLFAPHLFVVVDSPKEAKRDRSRR